MDSTGAKTAIYVFIVLTVVALLGLAIVKINRAANSPETTPLTQSQRLDQLEKSPGVTTPAARNFIHNERTRQNETRDVFDQTTSGQ